KNAVRNVLTRSFLHRRWWLNDPDCLMVRDTHTRLSIDEVRTLATAIALTDGMLVISDAMRELSAASLDILQRTAQLAGGRATAVDLFDSQMPELLVSRSPQRTVVAVFNFSDAPKRKQ